MKVDTSSTSTNPVAVDEVVQAQRAAAAGLFRVNGLPMWRLGDEARDCKPCGFATVSESNMNPRIKQSEVCGHYYTNNSRITVITAEGNIYWGWSSGYCSEAVKGLRADFFGDYGLTNSGIVGVFCSNGEDFLPLHLEQRLANPFGEPLTGYTVHF